MKVSDDIGDIELPEGYAAFELSPANILILLCSLDCFETFLREADEGERANMVNKIYWEMVEATECPIDPKTIHAQFSAAGETQH